METLETIVLDKEHTHAGQPCIAGDEIEVTPQQAAFLLKHKIGHKKPVEAKATTAKKATKQELKNDGN